MAEDRVQTEGNEIRPVEVSHTEAVLSPPDRPRRRNRTQGSPPATAKRQRVPLGRGTSNGKTPQEAAEEQAKAELSSALITKYSGLVRQIAGGFQRKLPRNVLRDDLIAAGMSGLWDAVRKHGGELLVLVPDHGSLRTGEKDPGALAVKDEHGGRVFQLAWKSDPQRPWVVAEDVHVEPAAAAAR